MMIKKISVKIFCSRRIIFKYILYKNQNKVKNIIIFLFIMISGEFIFYFRDKPISPVVNKGLWILGRKIRFPPLPFWFWFWFTLTTNSQTFTFTFAVPSLLLKLNFILITIYLYTLPALSVQAIGLLSIYLSIFIFYSLKYNSNLSFNY
jgi:hypothetical protein